MRTPLLLLLTTFGIHGGDWSQPAEVRHDGKLVVTYTAKVEGDHLIVKAAIQPAWHTFVMDNKQREQEKLKGKPSLGIERSTEIRAVNGLAVTSPWLQTMPKDLSQPEIRHFTWGYDKEATFAAKVRRTGSRPAEVQVQAQACAAEICKNIDVTLTVPAAPTKGKAGEIELKSLIPVRQ